MTLPVTKETKTQIVNLVRDFVDKKVNPVVSHYDQEDIYPVELVAMMKEIGLFGITIPEQYGGLGLDHVTLATIFEELSKGWMSLSGILGTHHVMATILSEHGTQEQKDRLLPGMALGTIRGGLALTEPDAGSDVQNISTSAIKNKDGYVLNGNKMFITNAENGNAFAVLAKIDLNVQPAYRGMGCFIVQKPNSGLSVGQHIDKLGYRGLDTAELLFENCQVNATDLVGGTEGRGFHQVMSGLESGRINVAARAVGVASAAFETAISYTQKRKTFGTPISNHQAIQIKLADMGTKIEAARHLTMNAARKKDSGDRVDMEAGMAKLFASEICGEIVMEAMRIHGGYGYTKEYPVERFYRDAPLMIIGEGTNEMQKLVIARRLLDKYKE